MTAHFNHPKTPITSALVRVKGRTQNTLSGYCERVSEAATVLFWYWCSKICFPFLRSDRTEEAECLWVEWKMRPGTRGVFDEERLAAVYGHKHAFFVLVIVQRLHALNGSKNVCVVSQLICDFTSSFCASRHTGLCHQRVKTALFTAPLSSFSPQILVSLVWKVKWGQLGWDTNPRFIWCYIAPLLQPLIPHVPPRPNPPTAPTGTAQTVFSEVENTGKTKAVSDHVIHPPTSSDNKTLMVTAADLLDEAVCLTQLHFCFCMLRDWTQTPETIEKSGSAQNQEASLSWVSFQGF